MNRRKTGFLRLFALVITAMTVMTGCKNETSAVMKGLSIENNIAYDYVLSSSLSTAKGFASELGVSATGSANTEEGVLSASAAILVDITKGDCLCMGGFFLPEIDRDFSKMLAPLCVW